MQIRLDSFLCMVFISAILLCSAKMPEDDSGVMPSLRLEQLSNTAEFCSENNKLPLIAFSKRFYSPRGNAYVIPRYLRGEGERIVDRDFRDLGVYVHDFDSLSTVEHVSTNFRMHWSSDILFVLSDAGLSTDSSLVSVVDLTNGLQKSYKVKGLQYLGHSDENIYFRAGVKSKIVQKQVEAGSIWSFSFECHKDVTESVRELYANSGAAMYWDEILHQDDAILCYNGHVAVVATTQNKANLKDPDQSVRNQIYFIRSEMTVVLPNTSSRILFFDFTFDTSGRLFCKKRITEDWQMFPTELWQFTESTFEKVFNLRDYPEHFDLDPPYPLYRTLLSDYLQVGDSCILLTIYLYEEKTMKNAMFFFNPMTQELTRVTEVKIVQ